MVTQEMEQFLAADSPASKSLETGRNATVLPIRCQLESPLAGIPFTAPFLKLHEAVLASYWHRQVKLGDLPLDSFRMLQALEWDDPTASESSAVPNFDSTAISILTESSKASSSQSRLWEHLAYLIAP